MANVTARAPDVARLAADFYFSLDTALTLGTLRALGQERMEELETQMLRSHQEHLFLRGLEKLGLMEEGSDAVRCARYHCLSNALGGLRMRYAVESRSKAWVLYETPCWLDSPWSPGLSLAVLRPDFMIGVMRAWHANNGTLLGNPGLIFAITELVARGDGRDAGYFLDLGRPAVPEERLQLRFGEEPAPGVELRGPDLDAGLWPPERQAKAWRNYAAGYAAARIAWLAQEAPEAAPEIIDLALRALLHQRADSLIAELGLEGEPRWRRAVLLFTELRRAAGEWLERAPGGIEPGAKLLAQSALERGWTAWFHHVDPRISVHHTGGEWTFERPDG